MWAMFLLYLNFNFFLQIGAPESIYQQTLVSVDDLADQVAEVLDYFG